MIRKKKKFLTCYRFTNFDTSQNYSWVIFFVLSIMTEFLDEVQMMACNRFSNLSYKEQPTLFLEFHGTSSSVDDQAQAVGVYWQDKCALLTSGFTSVSMHDLPAFSCHPQHQNHPLVETHIAAFHCRNLDSSWVRSLLLGGPIFPIYPKLHGIKDTWVFHWRLLGSAYVFDSWCNWI